MKIYKIPSEAEVQDLCEFSQEVDEQNDYWESVEELLQEKIHRSV